MSSTYYIYEHRDGEDCNETMGGGRAVHEQRQDFDKDSTPPCSGINCENDLVFERTVTVEDALPDPPEFRQEFIDGLSAYERALMLGMAMQSIRGNWRQLRKRLGIIGYICEVGVGDHLSEEFIDRTESTARSLLRKRKVAYRYPDGRAFRGQGDGRYGKLWEAVEKDPTKMRPLASHLPNDMTWDAWKFDQMEANDD
jgi:hypothetical protein